MKKLVVVNGAADPALSTPASILFAHDVLSRDQLTAAERYRQAYALTFGVPRYGRCLLGDGLRGRAVSDDVTARAREQLDAMVRGIGRVLETDEAERAALLTGLTALI